MFKKFNNFTNTYNQVNDNDDVVKFKLEIIYLFGIYSSEKNTDINVDGDYQ